MSTPRGERKSLQEEGAKLDTEISELQAGFDRLSKLEHAVAALRSERDAHAVADALQSISEEGEAMAGDEVALFYLIGAAEDVVKALSAHCAHQDVVKNGYRSIIILFAGLSHLENGDDVVSQLVALEVGESVVDGMTTHIATRDIQVYGSRIITYLAVNLNCKAGKSEADHRRAEGGDTTLWYASARVAVGKARRQYSDDQEVTQWADQAMRYLG